MRYAESSLDYFSLLKASETPNASKETKKVRVAILADCAIQQLTTLIKSLGLRNSVMVEVYEGGYDSVDIEILNPESALYAFDPQFVIVLMSGEKLKARLYDSLDRQSFVSDTVGRIEKLWETFHANSSAILVQSTFVLPSERAFGNYELKVAELRRLRLFGD